MWAEGARALDAMTAFHEAEDTAAGRDHRVRGDLLADREYTRVAAWHAHAHLLGFTPHFHLAAEQRDTAPTGTHRGRKASGVLASGVLVVDGIPYSPGMPMALRVSPEPAVFATRHQRAADAAFYAQREPYRLRVDGRGRNDNGSLTVYCAASSLAHRSMRCDNKPESLPGSLDRIRVGNALPVFTLSPKPTVCAQTKVTISFDELPFWQPHIPGTAAHQWSVHRRSNVESAFGNLKDGAGQSLQRGDFGVMGIAKVTIVIVLAAMAANLVEVVRWRERCAAPAPAAPAPATTRRPRSLTMRRAADQAHRDASRAKHQAARAGVVLETAGSTPPRT